MSDCRVRPYEASDKLAVAELQQHLWGGGIERNIAYLEWKYERNPYLNEPLLYLALQGDRVVGMRGVIGSRWILPGSGTPLTIPYADDLVVHPDHRGGGLHRLIMTEALRDLARRGFHHVINLSAVPITAIASLRMQWRDAGSFRPMYRRTAAKVLLDQTIESLAKVPLLWRGADKLAKLHLLRPARLFDGGVAAFTSGAAKPGAAATADDELTAMAELAARFADGSRIRHVHDVQYLKWRYANPLCQYHCLWPQSGATDGYVVLQHALGANTDRLRVNIVDWEASSAALRLSILDQFLGTERCHEIWCWGLALPPELEHGLQQRGFSQVPPHPKYQRVLSLLIRGLSDADADADYVCSGVRLDDVGNWSVRMINSMVC